ncbi:LytR C-terminal domain-containing protein [Pseudonocardia ailaonensis]|uniref:LytR C-terminal domain-containing protein n=1 Tax=Pseudonocardia ailaonensis TaxID=367279 RepID=A0ABN2NGZ6_9PSEU
MTAPTGPSPLKIGGIALVGVAVVAAVIGLVTLGTGGGSGSSSSAAGPESSAAASASAVAPPAVTSAAPDTNAVPLPSFTTTAPAPVTTTVAPVAPVEPVTQAEAPVLPLRVYNNSTIQGLAADAAADFRRGGWTVTDTTGYPYGTIPTSTVYYRPGTSEQASAERLASAYGLKSEPRFQGIEDASPGLIVIVTKDYQRH